LQGGNNVAVDRTNLSRLDSCLSEPLGRCTDYLKRRASALPRSFGPRDTPRAANAAMPICPRSNRRERGGLFASVEQFGAIDGVNVGAGARFNDIGACAFACDQFAVAEINLQCHFSQ
jgi:hypothetical protein